MSENVVNVTKATFEKEVTKSPVPVLLEFWAVWCGPCRITAPVLEQLGADTKGKLKVAKINVDEERDLSAEHGIMSIPTMFIFKNGQIVDQAIGAMPLDRMKKWVESAIAK